MPIMTALMIVIMIVIMMTLIITLSHPKKKANWMVRNHCADDDCADCDDPNYDDTDNHLKPSKEEGKLDGEKEWIEQVQLRLCVSHWQAVSLLNKIS